MQRLLLVTMALMLGATGTAAAKNTYHPALSAGSGKTKARQLTVGDVAAC